MLNIIIYLGAMHQYQWLAYEFSAVPLLCGQFSFVSSQNYVEKEEELRAASLVVNSEIRVLLSPRHEFDSPVLSWNSKIKTWPP